ncbi:uncharacterized protein YceK [Mesocricetibacter intestinalis]|uniref:Uncharacterized protein YceK n=1 Tax=Mesocricetibacter intestinalis TaxID=1521930 RepID=A0A4R6V8M1_9PAST|nr:YceK/YidQ family lipoprotein [Mesocricetibacter intestinalis]TDQ58052.1 uncharacterized protein YceK [Mesocricetibacter intestinalis]
MKKGLLILTALLGLNGCGTLVTLLNPAQPYSAYAGTKYDWEMAQKWGLPILDLPLSFLLDSLLLSTLAVQE